MSSTDFHERSAYLSTEIRGTHGVIVAPMNVLAAADWYSRRREACHDKALEAVMARNGIGGEERRHAAWVDPAQWAGFFGQPRDHPCTDASIALDRARIHTAFVTHAREYFD